MSNKKKLLISAYLFILTLAASLIGYALSPKVPFSAHLQETFGLEGERAWVANVIDGDTIQLLDGKIVRFVGIDTPETVDPKRPVGCWGKQASLETKGLLKGKEVILQKDVSEEDKYGRLLRLVYLPLEDGSLLFVNDYLIRAGFAKALTYPPDISYDERFKSAQEQAKIGKKGLWGKCVLNLK